MGILLDDGFRGSKSNQVKFGNAKPAKVVRNDNITQDNPLKKLGMTAAAVGTLGSGAILLYLGVRGVNYPKEIRKIYQSRVSDIAQIVIIFKEETLEIFEQQYKKFAPYVTKYVKSKMFDSEPAEKAIQKAKDENTVISLLDNSFSQIKTLRYKTDKPHLSEADNFRSAIYDVNNQAYQAVSQLRNGRGFDVLDKSIMPKFKNGKYEELIENYEAKLGKMKRNTDQTMFQIQNQITDEYIHDASVKMRKAIVNIRNNHINNEEKLMEISFNKIAELLNLGNSFLPLFKKGLSLKNLHELPTEDLKQKNISQNIKALIHEPYIAKILERTDFTNISTTRIQNIYNGIPTGFDIRQLNLITDRLRLEQAILNKSGKNTDEYKIITAKLEFLAVRLKEIGKDNLLSRCNIDFSKLNKEQLKAKMYYINKDTRKLGMANVSEVEDCLTYKQINPSFHNALQTVNSKPEEYFM